VLRAVHHRRKECVKRTSTTVAILNVDAGNRDTLVIVMGMGPLECVAFSIVTAIAPPHFASLRADSPVFRPKRRGARLAIFVKCRGVVMSTMVGMGQRLNSLSDEDEQPVYLLTRRRGTTVQGPELMARASLANDAPESVERAPLRSDVQELAPERVPLRSDVRELTEGRSPARRQERSASGASFRYAPSLDSVDQGWDDLDEDASNIRVIRGAGRQRAIRVLGALAIVGSLAGGTFVLQQPKVRREALSFVTMGHEEGAARLGRKIAAIYHDLRR
jgi:hypothetical protein